MFKTNNLDFAGFIASTLCALHCTALPIFLSMGLIESSHWLHNELVDISVIAIGLVIALFALVKEFRKHRSYMPISLAISGFIVLLIAVLNHHEAYHFTLSVIGGSMVASAHVINWRLGHTVTCSLS